MADKKKILDEFIKNFHVIRYDVPDRRMRRWNNGSREKNPLRVDFWALNEDYANEYNSPEGIAKRSETDVSGKFLDMRNEYKKLKAYKDYIDKEKLGQFGTYMYVMDSPYYSKTQKNSASKSFKNLVIDGEIEKRVERPLNFLMFQDLSDFERQKILADELKEMGYDGYYVDGEELAVFPWAKDYGKR